MKKNYPSSLFIIPLFLLVAACSRDANPAPTVSDEKETVGIPFSAGMGASASQTDEGAADTRDITIPQTPDEGETWTPSIV